MLIADLGYQILMEDFKYSRYYHFHLISQADCLLLRYGQNRPHRTHHHSQPQTQSTQRTGSQWQRVPPSLAREKKKLYMASLIYLIEEKRTQPQAY